MSQAIDNYIKKLEDPENDNMLMDIATLSDNWLKKIRAAVGSKSSEKRGDNIHYLQVHFRAIRRDNEEDRKEEEEKADRRAIAWSAALRKEIRDVIKEQSEADGREFVEQEIVKILRIGNKVEAIKKARELTFMTLKDALELVNDVASKYGIVIGKLSSEKERKEENVVWVKIYKSGQGMGNPGYSASVQSEYFAKTTEGKTASKALRNLADAMDRVGFLE